MIRNTESPHDELTGLDERVINTTIFYTYLNHCLPLSPWEISVPRRVSAKGST
uniref:Bm1641 n=1 Tax=Brugia malayi TaxID=6279 RepID=A0A1I9G671_BRUMA|nr:Bm1641 [Brugia malayi]